MGRDQLRPKRTSKRNTALQGTKRTIDNFLDQAARKQARQREVAMRYLFQIQKSMPVITKDGKNLGRVEKVLGPDAIIVSGSHQPICERWVSRLIEGEVYLSKSEAQIREKWRSGELAVRRPLSVA